MSRLSDLSSSKVVSRHLKHKRLAQQRRRRMFLERLEDRTLLATMVWDGSSSANWSDAANWVGDIAPSAGDDLFFPAGAANLTNTNNLPAGTSFNTIVFTGGGYNITGNAITLEGGLTANNVTGNNSFLPAITLGNGQTMMSANPGTSLTLGAINTGNIQGATNIFGNSALILDGAGTLVVSGVVSGQGSITKLGSGTGVLQGANTHMGLTDVRQGYLRIENASALGAPGGAETQIQPGAQLQTAGTFTVTENLALREAGVGFGEGTDPSTLGALRAMSGTVTWTGNMDLAGGNNLIGAASGATLIVNGVIANATAAANRLIKVGPGTLRIAGTQSNVYRGETVVLQGTLELGKTAGLNAIGGNLVIGDHIGGDNAATVRLLANNQIPHVEYFGVNLTTTTMNSSGVFDFNGFSDVIGNLTINRGSTYSSDINLNGGTLTLGGSTLTVNGFQGSSGVTPPATITNGTFDLGTFFSGNAGGAVKAFNVNDSQLGNVAPDLVVSANIAGTADIGWNKGGGGTLVLSGNNANAGPVTLGGGIVGIGSNTAFGTGLLALQGATLRAIGANRTVTNVVSLDGTIPVIGDLNITFNGAATLTGDRTIQVMDPAAVVTFAAPVGEGIFASRTLNKSGRGTLQLTAANTFSGTYTINNDGGTTVLSGMGSLQNVLAINVGLQSVLRLDNSGTNLGDRINNVTSIALNGELALVGNATANTSEVTGPINTGDQVSSTITVQNTSGGANSVALVGNALGINGTRLINFRALGGGGDLSATGQNRIAFMNSPGNLSNGILLASRVTTATGVELATFGNGPEGVGVMPVPATAYTNDLENAGPLSNVRLTTPGTYTLTRSKQINSLIVGPGVIINGDDVLLNVTSGIYRFVGTGAASINVESINASNGSFFVDTGMTASIGGNIVAGSVHKGGNGRLILSGDNTFSGTLTVNEGFVNLQRSTAAGSTAGSTLVRQGGTLELQETTFGAVNIGLEPLTLHGVGAGTTTQYADAQGAIRNVAGNNSWAGTVSLAGDATDLTGPLLLNGFPITVSGNTFFNVNTGSRLTITGAIVNNVEVIKRGAGTLEYAGVLPNTYDAGTRILEGTLELNKDRGINSLINTVFIGSDRTGAPAATLRLLNSDQMRDDRGAFVHSSGLLDIGQTEGFGGTLQMVIAANGAADVVIGTGGTLTTNVDLFVFSAGEGHTTGATITGGTVALQYQGIVAAAGTRTWQINDGANGNDLTITSAIVDGTGLQSVGVNKNGFGTLEFGGATANTYTGTTSVNEGTLLLNKGTGTGGVNALNGPVLVGDTNPQSGFANSDILRLLQPNQIPDFLAAIDVRNTGWFDLNNNNETIGNVDAQVTLTVNGGSTVSTGTGTLTINGDIGGNPAQGAVIFTPVAVATINGRLNLGSLTRTISIGDRSELPVELAINADISGTGGINLQGGHTLLLSGNNTFSGDTYRSNGNWAVGSDTAFGTAKVFLNGGHLATHFGPRAIANEFIISGATIAFLAGNGTAGSGALGGGGNNLIMNGPITITGGSFLPSTATAGVLEFAGTVGESLNVVFTRKQGPGTLVLSSPIMTSNGFEVGQDAGGNSRHNGGTVVLRGQGTLLNTNVTIGGGGVFQVDNSQGNLRNRLRDTALIDLFGGTLALVGGAGAQATESFGQLRPRNTFTGTVQVLTSPAAGSSADWRFTNLAVEGANQGSAVKFVSRGQNLSNTGTSRIAFNTSPPLVDGIIIFAVMQGSTGYDFATMVNTSPATTPFDNFITPLTSGANFATTLAAATPTVNVKLAASEAVAGAVTANAVLLANGGIVISGAGSLEADTGLLISNGAGNQINTPALTLGGAQALIFVNEASDLTISSGIAGAVSSFAKNGKGLLTLSNNANPNTYPSIARITEGTLRATKDTAFGTAAGTVTVTYGATLELAGGVTIPAEQLTLAGQGEANLVTIPLRSVSGVNTWQGNVAMNTGRTGIEVVAGSLIIGDAANPGIVSANGWNKFGAGTLQLAGNSSNTNNAQSNIWQGTVELNKSNSTFATINAVIIGDPTNGGDNADVLRFLQDEQLGNAANYTITVQPSGLLDLNNRLESITPSAAVTGLQINIGAQASGDVQTGATGELVLGSAGAANVVVGVFNGGFPVAATISGNVTLNGPTMQFNVGDSAGTEDLILRAVISGSNPITIAGNNGRTVLDPRNAANAVTPNLFNSNLTISQGEIVARSAGALGTTSGTTSVVTGSLLLDGASITGESLTLNGAGYNTQGVIRNIAGNNTWSGPVTLAGTTTVGVNESTSLNFSGTIGQSVAAGLTKQMPGNLIFSGTDANSFTGTMTVNEGTLTLNKTAGTNAIGGPLTIGNNAGASGNFDAVVLQASNQIPDGVALNLQSTGRLILGTNSETVGAITMVAAMTHAPMLVSMGAGVLTLNGNVTLSALGGSQFTTRSPGGNFVGNLNLGNATRTFTINDAGLGIMETVIDAAINGGGPTGALTSNGTGLLVLTNNNTAYTGTTTLSGGGGGGIVVRNNGALGTGPLNVTAAASLYTTNYLAAQTTITLPNTINLNADLTIRGDNHLVLSGPINGLGAANRSLNLNVNNGANLTLAGNVNLSDNTTARTFIINNNTFNHLANVTGFIRNGGGAVHGFQKGGNGTLQLSANNNLAPNNDFRGTTTVATGILRVAHNNALGGTISEVQRFGVNSTGGGSFTITYNGQVTAPLTYTGTTPPTTADVAAALNALNSVARTGGNVTVTSTNPTGPSTVYDITFGGALSGIDVTQISAVTVTAPVTLSTGISTPTAGSGGTFVNNPATLQVIPGLNVPEPLTLNNNGLGNLGALRFIDLTPGTSETTTWSGNINFNANQTWVGVDGGGTNPDRLIIAGTAVSGGAALTVKTGAGELEFGGNTDNGQVVFNAVSPFDDGLDIRMGTVYFNKPAGFNAIVGAGTVTVGDGGGGVGADRLVLMGASLDHIAGTAPLTVNPSGLFTMAGAATTESIAGVINLQRWTNGAGVIDTTPTRNLILANTVNVNNLGFTDGSTPPAQWLSSVDLGTATRTFAVNDSLVLDPAEDLIVSGVIGSATAAAGITKGNYGTMALTAVNTYQGTTTVNAGAQVDGVLTRIGGELVVRGAGVLGTGGVTVNEGSTLTLNNLAGNANRIADAAPVTMNGILNLIGHSTGTTEIVGATTVNVSNNGGPLTRIRVNSTAGGVTELQLATLGRGGGATVHLEGVGANLGNTTNSRIQVLGGTSPFVNDVMTWATISGPAGFDLVTDADGGATTAPYFPGRVTTYSTDINLGGIVRLDNVSQALTANRTVAGLLLRNGATVTGDFDLVVGTATAGLVVSEAGNNSINLGPAGELTYGGREPLYLVESGSTLNVNTLVNSTNTLRLERGGTLILAGDNDQGAGNLFTGGIVVNSGLLRATHADALGSATATTSVTVRNFATISLEAPMTIGNRTFDVAGPGVGNNGALVVTTGNAVTWGTGTTAVNWNTNPNIVNVAGTLTLNATVGGGAQLVKIGAGNLVYGGTAINNNTQPVNVNQGTLTLDKPAALQAVRSTLSIGDQLNFDPAGGSIVTYGTAGGSNNIDNAASVVINDEGQLLLAGASDIVNALTLNGSRIGSDNVATGAGSLQVNGALTLTGGTLNGNIVLNNNLTYNSNNFGPGGQAVINGSLDLNNATRTFAVNDNYAVNDLVINAAITNGRILKQGTGALALTNATNTLLAGINEVQTLTVPAAVTSFTLNFNGAVTQSITPISAVTIQTALEGILGAGNVVVSGAASPFSVQFTGILAGIDVAQLTSTGVGGTVTHATTTAGVAGFNLNVGTLALNATAALGGATLHITGNVGVRPIAGAALNLSSRIVVNPNLTTTLGGRRDFAGTDAFTLSGTEIVMVPSVALNNNYQVDDPLTATTISGVITGGARNVVSNNFPLVKTGFGKLVLTGANTFVGHVNVAAGILNVRNSLGLGSGGTPQSGSPFGSFVTVNGLAALELEGGVTIADRTLILAFAGSPIGLVSGYLNDFNGALRSISGNNTWRGAVDLRSDATVRTFFVGVDAGELTIEGSIVGTNAGTAVLGNNLVKVGTGTLVFSGDAPNQYTGTTAVLEGTLALAKTAGANAIAGTLVVGDNFGTDTVEVRAAEQIVNTAQVQVQSSGRLVLATLAAVPTPNEIQTITFSAQATGGTWQLDIPAAGTAGAVSITAIPFNITPNALQNRINQAYGANNVTVGGMAGRIYTLSFRGATGGVDVGGVSVSTGAITPALSATTVETQLGGNSNPLPAAETINTPIFVVGAASSAQVNLLGNSILAFNGDVTVSARPGINTALPAQITGATGRVALLPEAATAAATRTFTVNDGSGLIELSIAPRIVDKPVGVGIQASLTKTGVGRLSLSGDNTYSGTVTITQGVLRIQHDNALGDTGASPPTSTIINAGGVLEIDLVGTNTINNETFSINGTGMINDTITPNFTTPIGTGAIRNLQGNNTLSDNFATLITLAGASLVSVDSGRLVFDGVVAGAQVLLKGGAGDLEFAGSAENSNTANLIINQGKVVLNKSGGRAIVGGEIIIGNTGLGGDNSAILEIGPLTGGNQIDDLAARIIRISKTGRLNLNGQNETLFGNMFLDVGSTMSADIVTGAGTLTVGGLAGVGNVIVLNQGGTTATSPAATVQGNYNANGASKTFDVRDGLANVELNVPAIISNGGFVKAGRGAAIISGDNTYVLPTFVNNDSGTLIVNTPATVAATAYTVGAGSALGGSGTITGTVTVAANGGNLAIGGTINPGSAGAAPGNTGILTIANNVTFNARSQLFIDINGATAGTGHDQLRVTGTGTLTLAAGNLTALNGTTGIALLAGTGIKVIDKVSPGAITNQFINATPPSPPAFVNIGTRSYSFDYADNQGDPPLGNGNDFVLTAIPSTVVWDGRVDGGAVTATDDWTFADNWVGDSIPAPGDAVLFNDIGIGNGKTTPFNNFPAGTTFGIISLTNTSGSYSVGGNSITLNLATGANLISDNATNVAVSNSFNTPLVMAAVPQTITVKDGSTLTLGGAITLVAVAPLTVDNGTGLDASGSIVFGGTVNGAATLTINVDGDATFNGAVGGVTPLTSITITTADDVAFNGTVATTGNVTQTTGTGLTTISGGAIGGLLTINNEGVALAGSTTTVTGNTVFNATVSGVTQTAGALVTPVLTLTGVGVFSLPQAGNDFNSVTANTDGAITIRDTDDLLIAAPGIITTNDDVSLQTGTTLALNAPITLGTGDLTLNSGAATTQTAAFTAGGLELLGSGPYTLTNAANDVATFAANTTAAISYVDANAIVIGTVTGTGTIGVTVPLSTVTLNAAGAVTQTAPIVAGGLVLLGAGPFTLTNAGNDVGTLAANSTGAITYVDSNDLSIGTVTGTVVTLTSTAGALLDGNAAANNITASQLAASAATGIGTLADPLETTVANAEAAGGTGGVFLANTGALIIGGVSPAVGMSATGANINVSSTGLLTISEDVATTGNVILTSVGMSFTGGTASSGATGSVTLNGGTGAIGTTTAAVDVSAQDLFATAATGIDLDTTVVNVTLTTTGVGNVVIDETDALIIASLSVANGNATINAAGPLTNGVGTALTVSGNGSFGGSTVTLGNQAGDSLNLGSLAFNSAGAVNIELNAATPLGGASTAGTLLLTSPAAITSLAGADVNVANDATFVAPSINLGNQAGDLFSFGALNFTSPGAVSIAVDSSTQLVGANTAATLVVSSGGALTNAPGASVVVPGNANFGGATVTIGNQAGDLINVGSLGFTSTGAVDITDDNSTLLSGASTAGSLILTSTAGITNAAGANANVTGNANFTGTTITLGDQAGDVLNFGSLTFTATAGGVTIEENSTLALFGASTATGAIMLTSVDALGTGQDINLPAGASIVSTGSSVTLNAGDDAILAGNITSSLSTTINIDFGDAESPGVGELVAGTGGQVIITGVFTTPAVGSGGGTFLNGNDDFDTFTFSPQTTTEFRVDGKSPTGTASGDALQLDTSVATNASLIVPGTIAPYNGSGSGTWTFDSAHQQVLFTNIEDNSPPTPFHLTVDNSGVPIGNIVIMRDDSLTRVQIRDGSNTGPIVFQGLLTVVLSVRVLGSSGNDMVTVDDINTLPDFLFTVPGVNDNPNLPGVGELLFDGQGGFDTLVFNLNGTLVNQNYAVGTGFGPGNQEGEIQTVGSAITLVSYFQNVEAVLRIGTNATPGTSTVSGDASSNVLAITDNGALTRTTVAGGFVPYDVVNNSISQMIAAGLDGDDTLILAGIGSGPGNLPVALSGGDGDDTIRVQGNSGQTGLITLIGNAGSDIFQIYDITNSVDSITAQIVVDGSDGSIAGNEDQLIIIDTGDVTGDNVIISPVNAAVSQDYRIDGINSVVGNDVIFRNIDTLVYTSTQGNDTIDSQFTNTTPQHDLSVAIINGWLGADNFLLFTSDQVGGQNPTPTGVASGVAVINLNGDAPGNPNGLDGNDVFGQVPPGLIGLGTGNAGLIVPDTVRMIRPSVSSGIVINGGRPTGPATPTGDTVGDSLNLDISGLPGNSALILATASGVLATAGVQSLSYTEIEDLNLVTGNRLVNVQMGDTFVRGTDGPDLIQYMRNTQFGNENFTRVRVNTLVVDFLLTGKTLTYAGASNDYITQANVTFPAETYGEDGDDYISGGMGNDFLVGGLGNDQINASGGDNIVWGDETPSFPDNPTPQDSPIGGDDVLSALGGNDVFYGGGGNDHVSPGAGNDYIHGGYGNDLLDGKEGDDRIYGGPGNDVIAGSQGNDLLVGGEGDDQLIGGDGNDILIGGVGADRLEGGGGNDLLITGSVINQASSFTSAPNTTTFDALLYARPTDNDAALLMLLAQWGTSGDRSSLGTVIQDAQVDIALGGLGEDHFSGGIGEAGDVGPGDVLF